MRVDCFDLCLASVAMPILGTADDFQFIVMNEPTIPKDARTTIRKQAMKEIGLKRRKKGQPGDANQRYVPVNFPEQGNEILADNSADTIISARALTRKDDIWDGGSDYSAAWGRPIPTTSDVDEMLYDEEAPGSRVMVVRQDTTSTFKLMWSNTLTMSDYDRVRSRHGVELTDLSALALFSPGNSSAHRSASLFHNQQWSYMHYVPARYGITPCLTATTNAVLAKVRMILSPDCGGAGTCSGLYGVALRAVQEAIGNEMTAGDADVLCATQLLSLYEVSNISFRFLSIR